MSSVRRKKQLESAISIFILAVLAIIGAAILQKGFNTDMTRFGIDTAAIQKSQIQDSKSDVVFELAIMVPAGFETLSAAETYTAENLYEKINGKAPLYTESGFKKLFTRRFVSKQNENLVMELFIYDMDTVKNAFSVYSTQKRPDVDALPAFAFAYRTTNALYLVSDKYYIEIVGFSEAQELLEAMVETAEKITGELAAGKVTEIAEINLFLPENIVPDSIKLYVANAFGFEGLTDTFTCRYKSGDETVTAFLSSRDNPEDARSAADAYYNFLITNGGTAKSTAVKILEGRVVDFYGTTEIVFATGPFVGGIHEADNQKTAEDLAVKLINKLSETAKPVKND